MLLKEMEQKKKHQTIPAKGKEAVWKIVPEAEGGLQEGRNDPGRECCQIKKGRQAKGDRKTGGQCMGRHTQKTWGMA